MPDMVSEGSNEQYYVEAFDMVISDLENLVETDIAILEEIQGESGVELQGLAELMGIKDQLMAILETMKGHKNEFDTAINGETTPTPTPAPSPAAPAPA